jgi:hypothetical protein
MTLSTIDLAGVIACAVDLAGSDRGDPTMLRRMPAACVATGW